MYCLKRKSSIFAACQGRQPTYTTNSFGTRARGKISESILWEKFLLQEKNKRELGKICSMPQDASHRRERSSTPIWNTPATTLNFLVRSPSFSRFFFTIYDPKKYSCRLETGRKKLKVGMFFSAAAVVVHDMMCCVCVVGIKMWGQAIKNWNICVTWPHTHSSCVGVKVKVWWSNLWWFHMLTQVGGKLCVLWPSVNRSQSCRIRIHPDKVLQL